MILFFSGTGNSRYAARRLAEALDAEPAVSINEYLKAGRTGDFTSDTPYVFVAPTYAWQLPRLVRDFIRASRFRSSKDAYFVLTCGDAAGNAAQYAGRLCAEIGLRFRGLLAVVMPENYVAMFPVPEREAAERVIADAQPALSLAARYIRERKAFPSYVPSLLDRLFSGPVNRVFYPFCVSAKGFRVTNACVGCGRCERLCPLNNIRLKEGRPAWGSRCTHCMACICACPVQAIEYRKASVGKPRYYLD